MPEYYFTAKSQKGESYSGTREAKNEHELARAIRKEGYLLISASETKDGKLAFKSKKPSFAFLGRVSLKEKMFFVKNLQVMISAGVSLPKSLSILSEQSKNKKFKKVLLEVVDSIVKGESFSVAITKHPDVFSDFFINIAKVGEESGSLQENLGILARHMERENDLKNKIKGAMMYPSVIIGAMVGIGILMLVVVVPPLAEVFEEFEASLPLSTRMVMAFGTFFTERWYIIVGLVVFMVALFQFSLKTGPGKKTFAGFLLRAPILSPLVKKINATHTVRTLSSLIDAGTPLIRSLQITSDTLSNFYFKKAIKESISKVKRGDKLSHALKAYQDLYPLTVIQMIEVGEETGATSDILKKLADFYEEEVTNTTKNLSSIIEPIIMLLIGGVIGFFAVSMVQPIYGMINVL